jgi:redox-sensitive bicupin YhaK (pirin superfamily)
VIEDGGVQWMTAGRGIVHSEMPKVTEGMLWGFQLWINLPKKDKMVKPRSVCLSVCLSVPACPSTAAPPGTPVTVTVFSLHQSVH